MSADNYPVRYAAGESLLTLSLDAGCKPDVMRALLVRAGVTIRPKGGATGAKYRTTSTTEGKGPAPTARIARPCISRMYR